MKIEVGSTWIRKESNKWYDKGEEIKVRDVDNTDRRVFYNDDRVLGYESFIETFKQKRNNLPDFGLI